MDAVGVSLYKRVWPRTARLWTVDEDVVEDDVPSLVADATVEVPEVAMAEI
jgi:hypothetical protein